MRSTPFPHLPFPKTYVGVARLQGGGDKSQRTIDNEQNVAIHAKKLETQAAEIADTWSRRRESWEDAGNKPLPAGVPLLLQLGEEFDLDRLRSTFGFEIVSEQEDGYVIVLSKQTNLLAFLEKVNDFRDGTYGSKSVAGIHELRSDNDRLRRILSPVLLQLWPAIRDEQDYVVDVSILSVDDSFVPPEEPSQWKKESKNHYAKRVMIWEQEKEAANIAHDGLRMAREDSLQDVVIRVYGGKIGPIIDGVNTIEYLDVAGTFSARITISGKGLRDLALNLPHVVEIAEPDEVDLLDPSVRGSDAEAPSLTLTPPPEYAPSVCIIDSGMQEMHRLLGLAIESKFSRSFLPGGSPTDVADYCQGGGHGTRVAGAVLYPQDIPSVGTHQLPFWLQNARVLDSNGHIPERLFPPIYIGRVVDWFSATPKRTRLYNHSISASSPCRTERMSLWAATIDTLSHERDVLFIQAAGNVKPSSPHPASLGVCEHLAAGRNYPYYLLEDSCRIANPAQSLQALTVGSVAGAPFSNKLWHSMAPYPDYPSAFSRAGLGMWRCIKPEVVEYGGDYATDAGAHPRMSWPAGVCPELVRSTFNAPGPEKDHDQVGTSFAAPKVTHIAAALQELLPLEPALLYRALIVQSAQWPIWATSLNDPIEMLNVIRHIGYGIPSLTRATENSRFRVTLLTNGRQEIGARQAKVFEVPIPPEIRDETECQIRVEVTLSYSGNPKRTRRRIRGYLSTWLDWDTSGRYESREQFVARVLRDQGAEQRVRSPIPWTLGKNQKDGKIKGAGRNYGTIQKDWAVVNAYELPQVFCLAVVGHEGWSRDPEDRAQFALAVTFEAINGDVEVYDSVQTAVQTILEVEEQERVLVEVESQLASDGF